MHKNESFLLSLKHAFNGIMYVLKNENNSRFHLVATILVIILAVFLNLSRIEWVFLILVIFLVWFAEILNTAMEKMYDIIEPNINPKVKIGKDLSAAAVLATAILSVIVGVLILGPKLLSVLKNVGN